MNTFEEDLRELLRHYMEDTSNTSDSILAEYLTACLDAFNKAMVAREKKPCLNLMIDYLKWYK